MNAVVIVLWRPGDEWRERVWSYVRGRREQAGVPGRAVHLWHERGGKQLGHPARRRASLWDRYKSATGDRDAMRELLVR